MIRVRCRLADCVFFNEPAHAKAEDHACDCAHPEKSFTHYRHREPCPLYKKDWHRFSGEAPVIPPRGKSR